MQTGAFYREQSRDRHPSLSFNPHWVLRSVRGGSSVWALHLLPTEPNQHHITESNSNNKTLIITARGERAQDGDARSATRVENNYLSFVILLCGVIGEERGLRFVGGHGEHFTRATEPSAALITRRHRQLRCLSVLTRA